MDAYVLGGGGQLGASEVGMLRALIERDIVPDVVVGTSAGALNGCAVAYSPTIAGVARLANTWMELTTATEPAAPSERKKTSGCPEACPLGVKAYPSMRRRAAARINKLSQE